MATTTENTKYGLAISVPTQNLVKSRVKKVLGLNYPMGAVAGNTVIGTQVSKNKTSNYLNAHSSLELIRNNLRQLLLTEKGERVMVPDYGLSLRKFLFEPLDETVVRLIRDHILEGLNKWAVNIRVINLSIFEDTSDSDGVRTTGAYNAESGRLNIKLTLQLKDDTREIFDVGVILQ